MAMAEYQRRFEGGRFAASAMMSLEPAMRHDGYPNLFSTGEVAYGQPLVDRQHPHDLFMELSARLDIDIAGDTAAFQIGRAHVCTPVTNAHLVCRLLLEQKHSTSINHLHHSSKRPCTRSHKPHSNPVS